MVLTGERLFLPNIIGLLLGLLFKLHMDGFEVATGVLGGAPIAVDGDVIVCFVVGAALLVKLILFEFIASPDCDLALDRFDLALFNSILDSLIGS